MQVSTCSEPAQPSSSAVSNARSQMCGCSEARVPSVNQISSSRRCRPSATSTGAPSAAGASALSEATSARLTMRAWWKYVLISAST